MSTGLWMEDLGPYAVTLTGAEARPMAWLLRAIAQPDGGWACAHGRTVYDRHEGLPEALEHLRGIAETIPPATLFVHRLDGTVRYLGPS
jgi:hypothetical protein